MDGVKDLHYASGPCQSLACQFRMESVSQGFHLQALELVCGGVTRLHLTFITSARADEGGREGGREGEREGVIGTKGMWVGGSTKAWLLSPFLLQCKFLGALLTSTPSAS